MTKIPHPHETQNSTGLANRPSPSPAPERSPCHSVVLAYPLFQSGEIHRRIPPLALDLRFARPPLTLAYVEAAGRANPRLRHLAFAERHQRQLAERDRQLAHACDLANQDPDLIAIEQDFDALPSDIQEPWHDAPSR